MKNKHVLLVNPPFYAFFEYDRWWFSISTVQLASCLKEKGIETSVYDADKYFKKDPLTKLRQEMVNRQSWYKRGIENDEHYIWKHFKKTLKEINPDVVGVTTWSHSVSSALKILKICKEFNPDIKTCVGGYQATILPDYFKNYPFIDTIFVGLSEHSLPNWILNGCKEKFIKTSPLDFDITKIPYPNRDALLYPECFTSFDMGYFMSSRGCPFNCSFCSNKLLYGCKYQFRTNEQIRNELKDIVKKYNINHLTVGDSNFLVNQKKALEIAEIIKSFNLSWNCEGSIQFINEDFLKKLIDCGCTTFAFGIESGSQRRLNKINKRVKLSQIEKASKILNKYKVNWKAMFMMGFPDETLEEMEETYRFAFKIKPSFISLNSFVPLVGTDIYNEWISVFNNYNLEEFNQLNPRNIFIKDIDKEVYEKRYIEILKDFDEYNKSQYEKKHVWLKNE